MLLDVLFSEAGAEAGGLFMKPDEAERGEHIDEVDDAESDEDAAGDGMPGMPLVLMNPSRRSEGIWSIRCLAGQPWERMYSCHLMRAAPEVPM